MDQQQHIEVNGEVLKWARESIALNRNKVSKQSKVSYARLIQLEEGEKLPTLSELRTLSKIYKRTVATLMLYNPPPEKPLPKDRRTLDSKDLGHFDEKTILAVRKARALVQSLLDLRTDAGVATPNFPYRASLQDAPHSIATELRKALFLKEVRQIENPNQALEEYIEKVENTGVAVFQLSLTKDNLRGFSLVDEDLPVIAIKRGGEPVYSKIFTLFHELGHILLHTGGVCDVQLSPEAQQIEKWCNSFAAEMLIPSEELLQKQVVKRHATENVKTWRKMDLIELGKQFHVGPLAVLRSLLEQQLTTPQFYNKHHQAWNKPSFGRSKNPEGRNIAKEVVKEKGRGYVSLAFRAYDQNRIDLKDLADYLGVKLSYIPKTRELMSA